MKSHEFDESDVNFIPDNMDNSKIFDNRNRIQHEVNMLTVKGDDLLEFGKTG